MGTVRDFVRIKEAAQFLGVHENTLRNWGRAGKIIEYRHPINGYRLYKRSDLETVRNQRAQARRQRMGAESAELRQ
jgi:MerR family transcriptional regulator, copper efflux regulator